MIILRILVPQSSAHDFDYNDTSLYSQKLPDGWWIDEIFEDQKLRSLAGYGPNGDFWDQH